MVGRFVTDRVERVGLWERFEFTLQRSWTCDDPYRDLALDVTYLSPDGTTRAFWGFYDGEDCWRARFVPDQVGRWEYRARFSDGGAAIRGQFHCVPSEVPGMISRVEENPIWFGFRGGDPLLIRSLHVGDRFFASNFPDDRRRAFLDWVEGQGYNTLSIASHFLKRDAPGRGEGWDIPSLWPLDAGAFRRLEIHLDDLARRGLIVFPFAGFLGRDAERPETTAQREAFIRYSLARLGPYWNLLFNVAGPEPLLPHRPTMSRAEVCETGRMIAAMDPFDHLLTVHNATGEDRFADEPWLTFSTLQGPKTRDPGVLSRGLLRNHHPGKPLYAQETLWSGNQYHPNYRDEDLRRNAIITVLSAAALNFADNGGPDPDHRGNSSSGFSGSLALSDRRQARHDILRSVWDRFEAYPLHRMAPCPSLLSPGAYGLADVGHRYLVYLPFGGPVHISLRGGPYAATWSLGRDPAVRRLDTRVSGPATLDAPSRGEDWWLDLQRI